VYTHQVLSVMLVLLDDRPCALGIGAANENSDVEDARQTCLMLAFEFADDILFGECDLDDLRQSWIVGRVDFRQIVTLHRDFPLMNLGPHAAGTRAICLGRPYNRPTIRPRRASAAPACRRAARAQQKRVPFEVVGPEKARVKATIGRSFGDQPLLTGGSAVTFVGTVASAGGVIGSISGAEGVVVG